MPSNKYALLRYRIIDRAIGSAKYTMPSKEHLRQACEEALFGLGSGKVSLSTIEKDIWAMRNESDLGFYAPIAYDIREQGYFYTEPGYTIANVSLGDTERDALAFAAALLESFKDTPLLSGYERALEKVLNRVRVSSDAGAGASDFVLFEHAKRLPGMGFFFPLREAIMKHLQVEIAYRKFGSSERTQYTLHPLVLKEYNSMWYLVAHNPVRERIATFGLDRISDLKVLDDQYHYPSGFDASAMFAYSVGISEGSGEPMPVVIRIHDRWLDYLRAHPIHRDQVISSSHSSGFEIELFVKESMELYSGILSFGSDAEVVSPPELRDRIASMLTAALQKYTASQH